MTKLYKLGKPYVALKLDNAMSMTKIKAELKGGPRMRGTLKAAISDHPYPPGHHYFMRYLIARGYLVQEMGND